MPELNRSVIANIENRRRMTLTLEEALTLAYVLDVAPVHLIVPTETDDKYDAESYLVTPEIWTSIPDARAWIRGDKPAGDQDPRTYFSEVPEEDTRLEKPDEDKIDALSEDIRYMQKFLEEAGFINRAREQGDRGER